MPKSHQVGIKSIVVGSRILQALIQAPGPMTLKELSAASRMPPAKAHRYLVSFVQVGLVEQELATKRYGLGALALQIGIAAIGRCNHLERAIEMQREIRDCLDETTVLSVWGSYGPTIVHIEESSRPVIMTMKIGASLPISATAAGSVFAAFLPRVLTAGIIERELADAPDAVRALAQDAMAERVLQSVRESGIALNKGRLTHGVDALAVPLLGPHDVLVAVLSVISQEERLDMQLDGATATLLHARAETFRRWPMDDVPG